MPLTPPPTLNLTEDERKAFTTLLDESGSFLFTADCATRMKRLVERADAEPEHTEGESFVAEEMLQLDFEMLNDDGNVFGCTLGQVLALLRSRKGYIKGDPRLLHANEDAAIVEDLMGLECLINHHDYMEVAVEAGGDVNGAKYHAKRSAELLAIGRALIAKEPDAYSDEAKSAFDLRYGEPGHVAVTIAKLKTLVTDLKTLVPGLQRPPSYEFYERTDTFKCMPQGAEQAPVKISSANVAVDQGYFWNNDMTTCPRLAKVQLLTQGGLPQYGYYDGNNPFYTKWAPLPKIKEE